MATLFSDLAWDSGEIEQGASCTPQHLAPRFALELAPDTILAPHLYGFADKKRWNERGHKRHRQRHEMYTVQERPTFVLYVARGDGQRRYLESELAPALPESVALYVLEPLLGTATVLSDRGRQKVSLSLSDVGTSLDALLGESVFAHHSFDFLRAPWGHPPLLADFYVLDEARVERIEAHPTRLWEAFLLRGHWERWELVQGEVPLVANLPTPAAAAKTLGQWLHDAVLWTGCDPSPADGWIAVGRFRFREIGCQVNARVRLTPADIRVAFMPNAELPGADELPTLPGLLCAGNEGAKVEMLNGYAWATADCEMPGEVERLAAPLALEIQRLGGRHVDIERELSEFPEGADQRWVIEKRDHYLTVFLPLGHESSTFWDVFTRRWRRLDPGRVPLRILQPGDSEAAAAELESRVAEAFAAGAIEVWVAWRGRRLLEIRRQDAETRVLGPTDSVHSPGITSVAITARAVLYHHGEFLRT